jgi:hypothetical protein
MSRLQNYINTEETVRAKDNGQVDTIYKGLNPEIKEKKGAAYYVSVEDRWYFKPELTKATKNKPATYGKTYRVKAESLDFEP